MKKIFSVLLAFALLCSLAACGRSGKDKTAKKSETNPAVQAVDNVEQENIDKTEILSDVPETVWRTI